MLYDRIFKIAVLGKLPPSWEQGEKGSKGQKSHSLVCFQTAEGYVVIKIITHIKQNKNSELVHFPRLSIKCESAKIHKFLRDEPNAM